MPLKIVWYTFPLKTVGGGERLLLEGIQWFKSQGIDAMLFADGEPVAKEAFFDGRYSPPVLIFPRQTGIGQWNSLIDVHRKVKFLKSVGTDIILANSQAEAAKLYFHNLLSFRKIPYICFIHGSFFQFDDEVNKYALIFRRSFSQIWENDEVYKSVIPRNGPAMSFWIKLRFEIINYFRYLAVKRAKAVFVMTRKQKNEIELLYGHRNVIVNHGAFSKDIFNYRQTENKKKKWKIENKTLLFSICRLVAKKRVDLIIRSFYLYYHQNPNAVLFIGGNGPEKGDLEGLTIKLGLKNAVKFLGYIDDDELLDYYCSADVFLTADNADYDITTFVALALGKKVIASSQHEFEPHLNELNLLFHAAPTPEGFAVAIAKALESAAPPTQPTESLLDDYTWEYYFTKILKSLKECLQKN